MSKPDIPPIANSLRQLDGIRIPGGCDQCDAYQTVQAPAHGLANVTQINVHHDDWCPVLKPGREAAEDTARTARIAR